MIPLKYLTVPRQTIRCSTAVIRSFLKTLDSAVGKVCEFDTKLGLFLKNTGFFSDTNNKTWMSVLRNQDRVPRTLPASTPTDLSSVSAIPASQATEFNVKQQRQ